MSNDSPREPPGSMRRSQRLWLTAGEIVGALALLVAVLNLWESHQQHAHEVRVEQARSNAEAAFVAAGEADAEGQAIALRPLKDSQAIQSQTFHFPTELIDHPILLAAERPRIQADWLAPGVRRLLESAHAPGAGAARAPVVIETVFVEDGDTRTDVSLYEVGFAWKRQFLAPPHVRLTGIAMVRRGLAGDARPLLEARWATLKAAVTPTPKSG